MFDIKREVNKQLQTTLDKFITDAGKLEARVGWFKQYTYPEEHSRTGGIIRKGGIPVAQAAATNEFGVPEKNIPARPFMRPTIMEEKQKWAKVSAGLAKEIIKGKMTAKNGLIILSGIALKDFKKKIQSITTPGLSPATIKNRLSKMKNGVKIGRLNKPLVETGLMFDTINYEIVE